MAKPNDTAPDLGLFFGDQGGPGTALPQTDAYKNCPFLDAEQGSFCSLDGAMCPFVGFNYRKCRKYTNNVAKGNLNTLDQAVTAKQGKPPRVEALSESKRGEHIRSLLEAQKGKNAGKGKNKRGTAPKKEKVPYKPRDEELIASIESVFLALGTTPVDSAQGQEILRSEVDKYLSQKVPDTPQTSRKTKIDRDDDEETKFKELQAQIKKEVDFYVAYLRRDLNVSVDEGSTQQVIKTARAFQAMANAMTSFHRQNTVISRTEKAKLHPDVDGAAIEHLYRPQGEVGHSEGGSTDNVVPIHAPTVGQDTAAQSDDSAAAPETGNPPAAGVPALKINPKSRKRRKRAEENKKKAAAENAAKKTAREAKKAEDARLAALRKAARGPSQTTPKNRTYPQFAENFTRLVKDLTPEERERLFASGGETTGSPEKILEYAKKLGDNNDRVNLAKLDAFWTKRLHDVLNFRQKRIDLDKELDYQIETSKRLGIIDDKTLKFLREDPERLGKVAHMMNTARKRLYTLEAKNMNIGDQKITKFMLQATLPVLDRTDYEVMRMSEQLGLAAIQKQHMYGRGYGKFNTWNLMAKQVITPILLMWSGHHGYIRPLLRFWPQAALDSLFFSHIQKQLPTLRGSTSPQLSRDTKFELSQKMTDPGRSARIMKGFDTDPAGVVLPPDYAVLHSRTYPTTKESWPKARTRVLSQRYQQVKTRIAHPDEWRRGYLRGD